MVVEVCKADPSSGIVKAIVLAPLLPWLGCGASGEGNEVVSGDG